MTTDPDPSQPTALGAFNPMAANNPAPPKIPSAQIIFLPPSEDLELLLPIERKFLFAVLWLESQDCSGFGMTNIRLRKIEECLRENTAKRELNEIFAESNYHPKMVLEGLIEQGLLRATAGMFKDDPIFELTAKGREALEWGSDQYPRSYAGLQQMRTDLFYP